MQGLPLAMIAYGIGILLVIKNLKNYFPGFTQPWYIDDAGALGMFTRVEACFCSLEQHIPRQGCYPEPSKKVLIVHPDNLEARKLFVLRHKFKVCMGAHYLGSYIGDENSKRDCLKECR